jgi:peroxiredoxin
MKKSFFQQKTWHVMLLCCAAFVARADDCKLDWQSSGISKTMGAYPMRLALSPDKPAGIKAVPADLSAPLYGKLQLGPAEAPATFFVILDEPEGKPSRLFVDANANGDLTDDPPAEWQGRTGKAKDGMVLTNYTGGADLQMAYGVENLKLHLGLRRVDSHTVRAGMPTNILLYYRDYGRVGDVSLGGKTYHAMLLDKLATGDFRPAKNDTNAGIMLFLDLNHNGKFERNGESFDAAKPFNIGGTNYQVAGLTASGGSFHFVQSSESVPETLPRPILAAGHQALPFEAKTTDGEAIHFPQSYKGKLVLVDFWATWCPPCREEVPNVTAAYEKFHAKGFEVLGVSLDKTNAAETLAQFTKDNHMPWPEIYDGQYFKAAVAQAYFVDSIPHPFLVDGETGMIVAEGGNARGKKLSASIEKALAERR